MTQQIAIQGGAGSFSHMATLKIFPNLPQVKFCATFEEAFLLVTQKPEINLVCPCENTVAGRVPEFHSLLRRYSLQIYACLLYTSPSPRDLSTSRMPSSA